MPGLGEKTVETLTTSALLSPLPAKWIALMDFAFGIDMAIK